jgi:hypothetical protein
MQDSLSEVQKEFMGCVEMHLEPPEPNDPSYRVEATWRCDGGDLIRFSVSVDESDPDISDRRHVIEFVSPAHSEEPEARVVHVMKRVEASQGRYFWTEAQFSVAGPDVPDGRQPVSEVEQEVMTYVERIRALDCDRRLVEI